MYSIRSNEFFTCTVYTHFEFPIKYSSVTLFWIFICNKSLNVKLLFRKKKLKKCYETIINRNFIRVSKSNIKNLTEYMDYIYWIVTKEVSSISSFKEGASLVRRCLELPSMHWILKIIKSVSIPRNLKFLLCLSMNAY